MNNIILFIIVCILAVVCIVICNIPPKPQQIPLLPQYSISTEEEEEDIFYDPIEISTAEYTNV